ALHEALRLVLQETLEARWDRHRRNHELLRAGLQSMGLRLASQEGHQLWQLNAVEVPGGVDAASVRKRLLAEPGIEVGAGLGPMKGRIWRVGLMGEASRERHVNRFLEALGVILGRS